MFENWGLGKLAKHSQHESVAEMKHADALIRRILFLEGLPKLQDVDKLLIGETVVEILECDLALERRARPDLRAAIADCEALGDFVSRELFEDILAAEEEHIDWLETRLELVQRVGLENYSQSMTEPPGS